MRWSPLTVALTLAISVALLLYAFDQALQVHAYLQGLGARW